MIQLAITTKSDLVIWHNGMCFEYWFSVSLVMECSVRPTHRIPAFHRCWNERQKPRCSTWTELSKVLDLVSVEVGLSLARRVQVALRNEHWS